MKKAVALLAWVMFLMAIPTMLYTSHVYDQRREVRENNLRTLSKAAETTIQTFQTAVANVKTLNSKDSKYVCEFLERQPYLEWVGSGNCNPEEVPKGRFEDAILKSSAGGIQVQAGFGDDKLPTYAFDVQLGALLKDIPFSDTLELLFIVDEHQNVIHQHRPEGRRDAGLVVRSLDGLRLGVGGAYAENDALQKASSINTLQLSGVNYELLCQPLMLDINSGGGGDDIEETAGSWLLCGLVDRARSLRQSLLVAPFIAFAFFTFTVFGFLTWPAIKLQWMSGRDRLYFADMVFLLFGTWGGLMLATILILGVGSYSILNKQSEATLRKLADQIENNLQEEIDGLANVLYEFDKVLAEHLRKNIYVDEPLQDIERLYSKSVSNPDVRDEWKRALTTASVWPINSDFKMAVWVGPDGKQFFKATSRNENTPRVNVSHRAYFKAPRQNRLWRDPEAKEPVVPRFVEPIRSVTTGEFSTVVSICSQISMDDLIQARLVADAPDSAQDCPVVGVIETALVSTSRPVLAPGTGFAIIDDAGNVKLHSDERQALFENLYEEMDGGEQLQAMVLARSRQSMKTSYLGRPHQVFVKPLDKLPWSVVTFSDTEMISTTNIEVIGHAAIVALIFLFCYAFFTMCYFLWRGSEIPLWFWPGSISRRVARSRYVTTAAALVLVSIMVIYDSRYLLAAAGAIPLLVFIGTYLAYRQTSQRQGKSDNPGDVSPSQVRSSVISSFVLCVVTAILPAGIFFSLALDNQAQLLVRYENEYFAEQAADRNCAIDDQYRRVDLSDFCTKGDCRNSPKVLRRSLAARDLYRSAMFWPNASRNEDEGSSAGDGLEPLPESSNRCAAADSQASESLRQKGDNSRKARDTKAASIWARLAKVKPIYNQTVQRSRYLSLDDSVSFANNACWTWQPGDDRGTSLFKAKGLACDTNVVMKSGWPLQESVYFQRPVLIMGALLLIVVYFWTRYGSRRIFFGSLRMPPLRGREGFEATLLEKPNDSGCRLIVTAASQFDRAELLRPSALKKPSGDQGSSSDSCPSDTHGQFARYDMTNYFKDEVTRAEMLWNLENDIIAGKNILVVSPLDPFSLLVPDESPAAVNELDAASKLKAQKNVDDLRRWRQALSQFRIVILSFNLLQPWSMSTSIWQRGLDKPVDEDWLKAEFEAVPELNRNYSLIAYDLIGSSRRNALDRIGERAYGYYVALWDACSEEEKLVLFQLTFENVVNPKQVRIVRRLLQRGFLMRDPELRVMNQSFARFIAQVQDPSQVSEWEHKGTGMSWTYARWGLIGVLLLGLVFLLATQREIFNTTMMFLSAGAVSIPGLMKMATNLSRLGSK